MKFLVLTSWLSTGNKYEEWLTALDVYAKFGYAITVGDVNHEQLPILIHQTEEKRCSIISYDKI